MKINLSSVVRFIMTCWSLLWGLVESYGSDLELEWYGDVDGFMTGIKKEPWLGSYGIEFCLGLMINKTQRARIATVASSILVCASASFDAAVTSSSVFLASIASP